MRGRRIICAALLLLLPSCAGRMIQEGMQPMVGQPLNALVAKIGMPNYERMIAGQKVYVWENSTLVEGTQSQCQLRVFMAGESISSFDFDGSNARCLRYASALRGS